MPNMNIKHEANILFGPFESNRTLSILRRKILFQYTNVRPANGSGGRATFQMTSPLFPRERPVVLACEAEDDRFQRPRAEVRDGPDVVLHRLLLGILVVGFSSAAALRTLPPIAER